MTSPRIATLSDPALSLRQIEVFHAVVQARSITSASKALGVSQPSLSRTIRRIEDILRQPLFVRAKGRLVPTTEALLIHAEMDAIMRQLAGLTSQIARITGGEAAAFRIGATASAARALVPQALKALLQRVPRLELFIDVLAMDHIEDYLVTGRGECLIALVPTKHPLITNTQVGRTPLVAIVPREHPLARRSILAASDFSGLDFISFWKGGPHHHAMEQLFTRSPTSITVKAVVRFPDTAIALADQGMGVALVDGLTAMGPLGQGAVIIPIADAPQFDVFVSWNTTRATSQNLKKLIAILRTRLAMTDSPGALPMP